MRHDNIVTLLQDFSKSCNMTFKLSHLFREAQSDQLRNTDDRARLDIRRKAFEELAKTPILMSE